ncbi:DUF3263 domain-containing protein [Microbacterium aurugineum]|uniref:DUF3263 domain-containing protein n=1 Tax=Microbacterium aurugineum TaxID=2851642 RepID=UPI0035590E07
MTPANLLAFEAQHPAHTPEKTARIRRELGITEVRYYVLLGRVARSAEGIAAHPMTARMVRERADRSATRRNERSHLENQGGYSFGYSLA